MGNSQSQPPLDPSLIYLNACSRLIINKHVDNDEMRQLARQLTRYDCLTEDLFFHSTPLDTQKITILLLEGLIKNASVRTLDLSNTNFNDFCAKPLGQFLLHNSTLETLLLNDNQLTTHGAMTILRALEHNTTLTELQCHRNPIADPNVHQFISNIHSRPAIQYQKRDIDHTISINHLPSSLSQSPTPLDSASSRGQNKSHMSAKSNSNLTPNAPLDSPHQSPSGSRLNRSGNNSLHQSPSSDLVSQVIVVTATPTLSLNSTLNIPTTDAPRERRRSRTGSRLIEDLPSVATILAQNPSSPSEKSPTTTPSSRAAHHLTTSSRTKIENAISPPQKEIVFSQEDDDEALSYVKPHALDPLHISQTGSDHNNSSVNKSASKNQSPSVKSHKKDAFASASPTTNSPRTRNGAHEDSDGGGYDNDADHNDDDNEDDDEEWYLNDADYRRSTTNLGFIMGDSQKWDLGSNPQFNPGPRAKVRVRNLQNVVIEEGNEEEEEEEEEEVGYDEYDDLYDDEDYEDAYYDDNFETNAAVDRFFKQTVMAKHGVMIEPFQTGYNVSQTVVTKGDQNGNSTAQQPHAEAGLDLLSYLTLDFEYFGTAQVVSNIELPNSVDNNNNNNHNNHNDNDSENTTNNSKKKKKGKKGEDKEPITKKSSKIEPDSLQTSTASIDDRIEKKIGSKKGKQSALEFASSDDEPTAPRPATSSLTEHDSKTRKGKKSKAPTKTEKPSKPDNSAATQESKQSLPPPPQPPPQPPPPVLTTTTEQQINENANTQAVFANHAQEDNNGTLTSLINHFLHENNSEANALPNFGRMCKLYRKNTISVDRYGQVLLYYFNFSQLCRLLPRLIISLYESEFPGEEIDEYGPVEWFSTPQQAIAIHSMIHYHETIEESELFQLSLTCCKVPLTLTPFDGNEYISFHRDVAKARGAQNNPSLVIHDGYKLWNSGVAFNLYQWWTKEGCKYTGLAEIEPIADSVVFPSTTDDPSEQPPAVMEYPTLESRMSLDFSRLSSNLHGLPLAMPTPRASMGNMSLPTPRRSPGGMHNLSPLPPQQDGASMPTSSHDQESTHNVHNNATNPPKDHQFPISPSFAFNRTQRFKTLDKKSLDKYLHDISAPPQTDSTTPQQCSNETLLPSVYPKFGQDEPVKPGTQPRAGAVKNSPFLAFDQTNPAPLTNPLSPTPQTTQTTPTALAIATNPTPQPTTPSAPTPTRPAQTKLKRYKSFQLQLDTIDDGSTAHGINTPRQTPLASQQHHHAAPTPPSSQPSDPKLDAIRQRLTLTRMASLTQQLQSNKLLPVDEWVLLARQPNHVIPSSHATSLDSIDTLTNTLNQETGKLRKEPRLSTLLLHLHLVFPNPSSPTGRYPIIDALPPQPSPEQIKAVYKKVSLVLHPDRLVHKHPSIAQLGTDCFAHISSAFKRFIARHDVGGG